ncbi:MAG: hypothetical protein LWX70_08705 [Sphingobacteriia bacterium]|nr:hypothetical protein [Sphingobacteriia bacterium]
MERKAKGGNFNLLARILVVIFIAEQIIFMFYVFYQKGTSMIDFISDQIGAIFAG